LRTFLPEESPEIKNIKNFYRQNYGLDSIGRVDSGIMKGYNPVSGSDFF
jgi:acyl carrier protein